ncbi:MAG: Hsp20/alpha crystallin family protein [Candidatus Kapabacteria bacterium]|nr:Hsp20/alpha crystallin family protein [Candidatus Kapabacteria bacterium]
MTIMRYDPFRSFERMARRMNELFKTITPDINFEGSTFKPRVDIFEDDKNVYVQAELSGIKKDDVKVTVNDDNVLTISGEKKFEKKSESETTLRTERAFGKFMRSFILPDNLDKNAITANYENGVLNLAIPKIEPPAPKEIEIKVN